MGDKYSIMHAADLSAMLPAGSRVMSKVSDWGAWTLQDAILARIEFWTHLNYYAKTKDAKKKKNVPEPLFASVQGKDKKKISGSVHDIDKTKSILARKRR